MKRTELIHRIYNLIQGIWIELNLTITYSLYSTWCSLSRLKTLKMHVFATIHDIKIENKALMSYSMNAYFIIE